MLNCYNILSFFPQKAAVVSMDCDSKQAVEADEPASYESEVTARECYLRAQERGDNGRYLAPDIVRRMHQSLLSLWSRIPAGRCGQRFKADSQSSRE